MTTEAPERYPVGSQILVFRRLYDNPIADDGSDKPNEFLGEFTVQQVLLDDFYSGQMLATDDAGKYVLINESEVSYVNGGSRFTVTPLSIEAMGDFKAGLERAAEILETLIAEEHFSQFYDERAKGRCSGMVECLQAISAEKDKP